MPRRGEDDGRRMHRPSTVRSVSEVIDHVGIRVSDLPARGLM
jgi:hypothetical protein